MLPDKNRLKKRSEFDFVKGNGQMLQSSSFGIVFLKRNMGSTRFGFIVSTKISKRATARNRVKRVLKEAIRNLLPKIKEGFDVVFLVKRAILEKGGEEIKNEVGRTLSRAGIISF